MLGNSLASNCVSDRYEIFFSYAVYLQLRSAALLLNVAITCVHYAEFCFFLQLSNLLFDFELPRLTRYLASTVGCLSLDSTCIDKINKFFVVNDNSYVNFNMIYHNGMNYTNIFTASQTCVINKYKNLKH